MLAIVPVNVPEVFVKIVAAGVPELTNDKPVGSTSFTSTLVAIFGPSLVTEIV